MRKYQSSSMERKRVRIVVHESVAFKMNNDGSYQRATLSECTEEIIRLHKSYSAMNEQVNDERSVLAEIAHQARLVLDNLDFEARSHVVEALKKVLDKYYVINLIPRGPVVERE